MIGNEAVLLMKLSTESGSSSMVPGRMNRRSWRSSGGDDGDVGAAAAPAAGGLVLNIVIERCAPGSGGIRIICFDERSAFGTPHAKFTIGSFDSQHI